MPEHKRLMLLTVNRQSNTGRMVTTPCCREISGYPADLIPARGASGPALLITENRHIRPRRWRRSVNSDRYDPGKLDWVLVYDFSSHGHELFGGGRMNSDRGIELSLGRAAVERDRQALNNFPGIVADHVAAKHLICSPVDNEFHHGPFITAGEGVLERLKAAPVNIDLEVAGPRLVLGNTDGPAIGGAENGRGDV